MNTKSVTLWKQIVEAYIFFSKINIYNILN